ncbi:HTH-type transcriptional regulator AcrR [Corynebacterium kalinowskii]|uniref:HTH-type transcriptional regulator AcrR n=1 Tax=Corynebacterium kalinowskii TaxID=2675216 RepID=A0A6B8VZV1_9CORY|nr:TetR/AcrR family transcriptional regulator [Corynebacterium kalinowskii]QGU02860.1 HTH-type transcriptional regulator AcrR [Corynebacterium kalinowskii]
MNEQRNVTSNERRQAANPPSETKTRILECSRKLFSERTFAQVSLKEIAEAAGVSAPLIIKHFQSKENLFKQTVDFSTSAAALFKGPFEELGRTSITETLSAPTTAHYSIIRTMTVTDGSDTSLSAIGEAVKRDILSVLEQRIQEEAPFPDPEPQLRAQAAMALLTGLSLMRRVGDTDFQEFPPDALADYYAELVQQILNGHAPAQ